jgi:hypothetical protein
MATIDSKPLACAQVVHGAPSPGTQPRDGTRLWPFVQLGVWQPSLRPGRAVWATNTPICRFVRDL